MCKITKSLTLCCNNTAGVWGRYAEEHARWDINGTYQKWNTHS